MSRTSLLLATAVLLATAGCSPENTDTASDQSPNSPDERTMLVLSDGLRLRSQPDQRSEIIQLLREGTILSATGRNDTPLTLGGRTGYWYRVRTPGNGTGWVFGAHLDSIPEATAAALLDGGPWDPPSQEEAADIIGRSWAPNYGGWGWGIRFYRNGSFNARYIGPETRNRFGFWRRRADDRLQITYIVADESSALPPPGGWQLNTSPKSILSRISLVHENGRELYNLTDRRAPGETVTLQGVELTVREETRHRVMGSPELLSLADLSPLDTLENRSTVRVLARTTLEGHEYAFVHTIPEYGSNSPPTGLLPVDAIGFAAN